MNKKSQIILIALWLLLVLSVLTVSIGHTVSLSLKIVGFQRDHLQAYSYAKNGIAFAINMLKKNPTADYDTLDEPWINNREQFEKIQLPQTEGYATISYRDPYYLHTVYGIVDEERKININTASKELLLSLLEKKNIPQAEELVHNICAWRGDNIENTPDYSDKGYANKSERFTSLEELMLVKGINQELYNLLKDSITIFGSGKLNINTAPAETLEILITSCLKRLAEQGYPLADQDLANKIITLRNSGVAFEDISSLKGKISDTKTLTDTEIAILNLFEGVGDAEAGTQSTCFSITSDGTIQKVHCTLQVVYDRVLKKELFWHES